MTNNLDNNSLDSENLDFENNNDDDEADDTGSYNNDLDLANIEIISGNGSQFPLNSFTFDKDKEHINPPDYSDEDSDGKDDSGDSNGQLFNEAQKQTTLVVLVTLAAETSTANVTASKARAANVTASNARASAATKQTGLRAINALRSALNVTTNIEPDPVSKKVASINQAHSLLLAPNVLLDNGIATVITNLAGKAAKDAATEAKSHYRVHPHLDNLLTPNKPHIYLPHLRLLIL